MRDVLLRTQGVREVFGDAGSTLAQSTADGVAAGTLFGLAGAIDRILDEQATLLGETPQTLITGGDAQPLLALLRHAVQHTPDLVLEGVAVYCLCGRLDMMRWGFAALLLANIGLLMWATWYREGVRRGATAESGIPSRTDGSAQRARRGAACPQERTYPSPSLVAAKPRPRCVSIGPFVSAELADKAVLRLTEVKQVATRRSEERKLESSYWVHLAPFNNRKQAERRLKEVERLGIRDVLIMPDADGKPAISLGLFTHADNAQKRLQELAEKGVQAQQEIRTVPRTWSGSTCACRSRRMPRWSGCVPRIGVHPVLRCAMSLVRRSLADSLFAPQAAFPVQFFADFPAAPTIPGR